MSVVYIVNSFATTDCIVQIRALKPWKKCKKYEVGGGNDMQLIGCDAFHHHSSVPRTSSCGGCKA
jgi:hypothetical protein